VELREGTRATTGPAPPSMARTRQSELNFSTLKRTIEKASGAARELRGLGLMGVSQYKREGHAVGPLNAAAVLEKRNATRVPSGASLKGSAERRLLVALVRPLRGCWGMGESESPLESAHGRPRWRLFFSFLSFSSDLDG